MLMQEGLSNFPLQSSGSPKEAWELTGNAAGFTYFTCLGLLIEK